MLRIAVCDDEVEMHNTLRKMLASLAASLSVELELLFYPSGEALLFDFPAGVDILILDVQMPALDGIETARRIRCFDSQLTIVFMTNYAKYALEGYKVNAYRYLLKPVQESQLKQELADELLRLERNKRQPLFVRNDEGIFVLAMQDIVFIETSGRNTLIHTGDKSVCCYRTMGELLLELDPASFFRCHTSYIINFAHVAEIRRSEVILDGGLRLPLSKHRRGGMIESFTKYAGGLL